MKPKKTLTVTLDDNSPKENDAVFDVQTQFWINFIFITQISLLFRLVQLEPVRFIFPIHF